MVFEPVITTNAK